MTPETEAREITNNLQAHLEQMRCDLKLGEENKLIWDIEASITALRKYQSRIGELEAKVYVGSHWQCPKCNFYQVNSVLAPDGIFADKRTPENCPNDGTEMMPVTWKQNAQDGHEGQNRLMQRITALESKVGELEKESWKLIGDNASYKEIVKTDQRCIGELKLYNNQKGLRIKSLESTNSKLREGLESIVNEYEALEKLEKSDDRNAPANYVLPIKKWAYVVAKEALGEKS